MTKNYIAHAIQAAALLLAATAFGARAEAANFVAKCQSNMPGSFTSLSCTIPVPAGETYSITQVSVSISSLAANDPPRLSIQLTTGGTTWSFYESVPVTPDVFNAGGQIASAAFPSLALSADPGTNIVFSATQLGQLTPDMQGMFIVISGTN
jgi:hypothetical protein